MSNKKPDKKIFYIAGAVCAATVAVTGVAVTRNIRSGVEKIQYEMEVKTPSPLPSATAKVQEAAAKKSNVPKETPTPKPETKKQKAVKEEKPEVAEKKQEFIMPTEGVVTTKFSGDALVYSPTFDDWRPHMGIDIDAEPDTQVRAVADGTVEKVFADEMMGNTIIINHGGDLVTKYSNLSTTELVKEGDKVKQGDIISGVGVAAAAERLQSPHLHFEVIYQNKEIDPLTKIKAEIVMPTA